MESPNNNNSNKPQPASGSPPTGLVGSQRAEGERSSTTSSAQHPTTAQELEPSSVDAIQSQTPYPMQLEIPSGHDDDAPPLPAAHTAALMVENIEDAVKGFTKNTHTNDLAPPIPPAQIAAMYEDMENAIKDSLKDNAPPLHDTQIAACYEEAETEKKGTMNKSRGAGESNGSTKNKPEAIEQGETLMPTIPPTLEVTHRKPPAPSIPFGSASPQATRRENRQTPSRRGQRQAAAVIYRSLRSMVASLPNDETSTPSIPMFHEVEATLVPNEPVYDAIPIPMNDGVPLEAPLPWWKRHQKYIFGGVGLIIGAAVALGVSLTVVFVVLSNPPSESSSPSQVPTQTLQPSHSFAPSPSQVPSQIPSRHPTNEPSQSFRPSFSPSYAPSISKTPSVTPSTSLPSEWPSTSSPATSPTTSSPTTSPIPLPTLSPVPAPSGSPPRNVTLFVRRNCEQMIEVAQPQKFSDLEQEVYKFLMQSYTKNFGEMVGQPQIDTNCEIVDQKWGMVQQGFGGDKHRHLQTIQQPTLLVISFTMQYESRYGIEVEDYPSQFQNYINSNLRQVTIDMTDRFLLVVEAKDLIVYEARDPTYAPSLLGAN